MQLLGAAIVLGAFVLLSLDRADPRGVGYLLANTVGALVLAIDALHLEQWGFLALEATWAIVSAIGLARIAFSRRRARPR